MRKYLLMIPSLFAAIGVPNVYAGTNAPVSPTAVHVPEPGTVGLLLIGIGIGLVLVMRKRIAQRLHHAS
jgi:hypothetical protein